jgi:hypothetical protein
MLLNTYQTGVEEMSITVNIPTGHDTVPLMADIVTLLGKHGLQTDSITTMEAFDIHVEVMAFPATPPERPLRLVHSTKELQRA